MFYSGITARMRDLSRYFAGKDAPVKICHQLTAGQVLCGALCLPLLTFGILWRMFPQTRRIFDVWYGHVGFLAGFILLFAAWPVFCLILRKWYIAILLSLGLVIGWAVDIAASF